MDENTVKSLRFEFGRGKTGASKRFEPGSYGFVVEDTVRKNGTLGIPELNSGFVANDSLGGVSLLNPVDTDGGVGCGYDGDGLVPLLFKAELGAEGNYLVKAVITADRDTEGLLFAGRRRMVMKRAFRAGERFTAGFTVNVSPIIPRTYSRAFEDTALDIALLGRGLALAKIEVSAFDGPTVYIAGDSTVTDQTAAYPYDPALSYSGWGQMLQYFAGSGMAVSNHAHSGLTTESMRSEGHYAILFDRVKKGDICLFQFAHNDQKLDHLKAFEGYTENLKRYIDEIKSRGATPVIVSPLARNTWKGDGTYNDLLEEYAAACRAISEKENVPYIDLHAFSMDFVTKNGRETARRWYFPSDYTHTNDYGAYMYAGFVYAKLCGAGQVPGDDWTPPAEPPVLRLPAADKDADAGADAAAKDNGAAKPVSVDRPDDILTRAEAFEMVIATVKFFPTNVYNDMFVDVVGHEVYAGSIQCAWQNGIIPASMLNDAERRIYPDRPATLAEFTEILRLGYLSRRPAGRVIESLDTCGLAAGEVLTRKQAAYICGQVTV
ncbi:MAG: rhamnogalacturonan acetylesterase [Lachnospiraceae bacterium]|nr:rhamnogalacturonan acetylesterase [Lachnospiraceae bacterium]